MSDKYFIPEPQKPKAVQKSWINAFDIEVDTLLNVHKARETFKVDGDGLVVAVLDTGLRITHNCFRDRVIPGKNFSDDGGGVEDVNDKNGHGTNVAGIIVAKANDERNGIAPAAKVVPLKVLPARSFNPIISALDWVDKNAQRLGISVVNMSLGAPGINMPDDSQAKVQYPEVSALLDKLVEKNISVVVAAGNSYYEFQEEGMSVPAIFRQVISVGAVYDSSIGTRNYADGAVAFSTHADQVTPFTQRLSKEKSFACYTDIFSAGAAATSAGIEDDNATSIQEGTSQAAPTIAGVILLLQQHYYRLKGSLPAVSVMQEVLRSAANWVTDGDDENDNVRHTQRKFPRVDAFNSLVALDRAIKLGNI